MGHVDYIRDAVFPSSVWPEQAPVNLALAAVMRGFDAPRPAGAFRYLELGCGTGQTLVRLAAGHPDAEFVGVDFNEAHVDAARRLAADGGVANVRVVHASFEEAGAYDLGTFDFVSTHGTYSWLRPATRDALLALVRDHLRPGGLFYVDHMTMPAKAAIAPVWRLLRELTADHPGPSIERVRDGLERLDAIRRAGSAFFRDNPVATKVLDRFLARTRASESALRHVAHHALAEGWSGQYFTELVGDLARFGLSFVGSARLRTNWDALVASPSQAEVLAGAEGVAREVLFDALVQPHQRPDVFVRGEAVRGMPDWLSEAHAVVVHPGGLEHAIGGAAWASTPAHAAVRRALEGGPARLTEIDHPDPVARVRAFLQILAVPGVGLALGPVPDPLPPTGDVAVPVALNRRLLDEAVRAGTPAVLVAPAIGSILAPLGPIACAVLDGMVSGADPVVHARSRLAASGATVTDGRRQVRCDTVPDGVLAGTAQRLREGPLGRAGVIAPA